MPNSECRFDPVEFANFARMVRQTDRRALCLVEGGDDSKFYRFFLSRCTILVGGGWAAVTGALRILAAESFSGAFGICDADFGRLEGRRPDIPCLFWTDTRDLEMELLLSPALDRVLSELCQPERLVALATRVGSVRTWLFSRGELLAYLRLHNHKTRLGLTFKTIRYSHCFDRTTVDILEGETVVEVLNKSERHDLKSDDVLKAALALRSQDADLRLLVRGHDVTEICALVLRTVLGNKSVAAEQIESLLRCSYPQEGFYATALYRDLRKWEACNPSYPVFKDGAECPA